MLFFLKEETKSHLYSGGIGNQSLGDYDQNFNIYRFNSWN